MLITIEELVLPFVNNSDIPDDSDVSSEEEPFVLLLLFVFLLVIVFLLIIVDPGDADPDDSEKSS